ncbi:hypothetical protein HDK64DRAFT_339521 [Phyllosticta capitalensis]|uniref:Uncharacterized protein n=1 Tax=Phyllosticta capitalensis TaxID=121624 RepID=A0ABR1YHS9_9PEZI
MADNTVFELHVEKAIPSGNFAEGPNVVRLIQSRNNPVDGNHRLLCSYLHIPDTRQLANIIQSIEGYAAVFREAESRSWFPAGDPRASRKNTWNQKRILRMFFPVNGITSIVHRFSLLRQWFLFAEGGLPAVGQAMAIVQIMSRLPHLFRHCTNIAAGATGRPVFHAEDVNRAALLLRAARKPPTGFDHLRKATALEYAYPEGVPEGAAATAEWTEEMQAATILLGMGYAPWR